MSETFQVNLNFDQLRMHRSAIEGREITEEELRRWLVEHGLYPCVDGTFLAESAVLDQLSGSDIVDQRPIPEIQ